MNDPRLKAVPPPDLSPAQIFALARQEVGVWRELAFANPLLPGASYFNAFWKALVGIAQATKTEHVNVAINELAELCMKTESRGDAEKLVEEIGRRREFLRELANYQHGVELSLEEIEEELAHHRDFKGDDRAAAKLKKGKEELEQFIAEFVRLRDPVQAEIDEMERYLRALERVSNGWPAGLLGKAMPDLPRLAERQSSPEESHDETTPTSVELTHDAPLSARRERLSNLAEVHDLLEVEVFVYSLYDLLGENNRLLNTNRPHRSAKRVVEVGIAITPDFGWGNVDDFFHGSGWKNQNIKHYLKWCGNLGGTAMFVRTAEPLPWHSRSLFTETEIKEFIEKLRPPLPKPEA